MDARRQAAARALPHTTIDGYVLGFSKRSFQTTDETRSHEAATGHGAPGS